MSSNNSCKATETVSCAYNVWNIICVFRSEIAAAKKKKKHSSLSGKNRKDCKTDIAMYLTIVHMS